MMYESLPLYYVTKHEVFVKFSELMKYKVLPTKDTGQGDTQMMVKIRRFHICRSVCAAIINTNKLDTQLSTTAQLVTSSPEEDASHKETVSPYS